jgi:hypothetical protein
VGQTSKMNVTLTNIMLILILKHKNITILLIDILLNNIVRQM